MPKPPKPGDVLALTATEGTIYVHYLGAHADYGDGIAVCPRAFVAPVPITDSLFDDGYVVFYPIRAAIAAGLAKTVGHLFARGLPARLRRPGARRGHKVETWIIEENSREEVKRYLSQDELQLPLAVIWNHEMLLQRVHEGWRPEHEGQPSVKADDDAAVEALRGSSTNSAPRHVQHYLYFPRYEASELVAKRLRDSGFTTEKRLGADGINWLVLARHETVPTEVEIERLREVMEKLAAEHGGEYDGWEAEAT